MCQGDLDYDDGQGDDDSGWDNFDGNVDDDDDDDDGNDDNHDKDGDYDNDGDDDNGVADDVDDDHNDDNDNDDDTDDNEDDDGNHEDEAYQAQGSHCPLQSPADQCLEAAVAPGNHQCHDRLNVWKMMTNDGSNV